jgi:hypothetical protein
MTHLGLTFRLRPPTTIGATDGVFGQSFAAQPSPKSNCPQFGGLHVLRGGCSGREV